MKQKLYGVVISFGVSLCVILLVVGYVLSALI